MKNVSVTILTPTYNRKEYMQQLYQSLLKQTVKDFKWLIVDDGSKDGTDAVIEQFKNEKELEIKYLWKENGGKHKAINYALQYVDTEAVMIVDSDDYLTCDAIETIIVYMRKYRDNKKIAGFSFLRQYPDGKINNKLFPKDNMICSYIDARINGGIGGDKAEVFFTKCLKKYPFPEFPNEKFLNEDVVWIRMALDYDMVHINKAIYIGNYLEDGLTRSGKRTKILNPLGSMERGNMLMCPKCKFSVRLKGAMYYVVFSKFSKQSFGKSLKIAKDKKLVLFMYPAGLAAYLFYKKKYGSS